MPGFGWTPAYFLPEPPPPFKPAPGFDFGDQGFGGPVPEEPTAKFDFNFPKPPPAVGMLEAVKSGLVKEETITAAVGRILVQMDKFGLLDGKGKHNVTAVPVEENAPIVRKTADDAAVLLKNDGGVLPLKEADLASLAMIGPGAGQTIAVGEPGEKALGIPARQFGTVDALRELAPNAQITYAVADDMAGVAIPASALSLTRSGSVNQADAQLDFTVAKGKALPAGSAWKWTGMLTVPSAGSYMVNLQMLGTVGALTIDGKRVSRTGNHMGNMHGNILHASEHNIMPTPDGLDNLRRRVDLTAGAHTITVTTTPDVSGNPVQVRLAWVTPEQQKANYDAAIAAARQAKTAVVFAWSRGRPWFGIPGDQNKLIEDVAAVNPNTIVVLNVSQPVALPWLSKVKGVLQMWFPGDEGGWGYGRRPGWTRQPRWPAAIHVDEDARSGSRKRPGASRAIIEGREWQDDLRGRRGCRLSMVRQEQYRTAVPVRLRALLFEIRVLGSQGRSIARRWPRCDVHSAQHGPGGERRSSSGVSRSAGSSPGRSAVRAACTGCVRSRKRAGRRDDPSKNARLAARVAVLVDGRGQMGAGHRTANRSHRSFVARSAAAKHRP